MCSYCWQSYGCPVVATSEVMAAAELIRRLYEDLGEVTGGPLHAILDDLNVDDDSLSGTPEQDDQAFAYLWDGRFERFAQAGEDTSTERKRAIEDTCRNILKIFRGMPDSHRAAAVGWHEGWAADHVAGLKLVPVLQSSPNTNPQRRFATDEEIADVIADIDAEPPPAGCSVPIPCPSFTEVTLKAMAAGESVGQ